MIVDSSKIRIAIMKQCKKNKEIAKEAGLCEGTIAKICRQDARVTNSTIGKIARALGCDPLELIKG